MAVLDSIYEKVRRSGNGMQNSFELIGRLLSLDASGNFDIGLHPTDDRRRVTMKLGRLTLPPKIKLGQEIRVNGYIRTKLVDGRQAISLRPISIRDRLDLSHFGGKTAENWLKDCGYRTDDATYRVIEAANRGTSHVRLQGFVEMCFLAEGKQIGDGVTRTPQCLHILLRQFENLDLAIPVRLYGASPNIAQAGKAAIALWNRSKVLGRRIVIEVQGRLMVDIKDIPNPDAATDPAAPPTVSKAELVIKVANMRVPPPEEAKRFMPVQLSAADGKGDAVSDHYSWANWPKKKTDAVSCDVVPSEISQPVPPLE